MGATGSSIKDMWLGGYLQRGVDVRRGRSVRPFRVLLDNIPSPDTNQQAILDALLLVEGDPSVLTLVHPQDDTLPLSHIRGVRIGAKVVLVFVHYSVGRLTGGGTGGTGLLLTNTRSRTVGERVYRSTAGVDGEYTVDATTGLPAGFWHGGLPESTDTHVVGRPPKSYQWLRPQTVLTYTRRSALNPAGFIANVQSFTGFINTGQFRQMPSLTVRFDGADSNERILSNNQHIWDVKMNFTRVAQGLWFGQRLRQSVNLNGVFNGWFTESFQLYPDTPFSAAFQWFFLAGNVPG